MLADSGAQTTAFENFCTNTLSIADILGMKISADGKSEEDDDAISISLGTIKKYNYNRDSTSTPQTAYDSDSTFDTAYNTIFDDDALSDQEK